VLAQAVIASSVSNRPRTGDSDTTWNGRSECVAILQKR
jgi:hypothetical protein